MVQRNQMKLFHLAKIIIWKVFQEKLSLVRVTQFLSTVRMKSFGFYLDFLVISITWS
jgi:hypothetical protein